jgi:hypothetical protein
MRLEPEQVGLLHRLADAARRVPRAEREFMVPRALGGDRVIGLGVQVKVIYDDLQQLVRAGLLRVTDRGPHDSTVIVTQEGYEFVDSIAASEPMARVEEEVTTVYRAADDLRWASAGAR